MDVDLIYRKYAHSVLRRARALLGSDEEAREVLQEIFLELLQKPEQFAERSAMSTFLYSVTTNRCLNRLRDQRTRLRLLDSRAIEAEPSAPRDAAPDEYAAARAVLAKLPADQAQAAVYFFFDEMTHEEIATQMNCSRRHVGDLLARLSENHGGRDV